MYFEYCCVFYFIQVYFVYFVYFCVCLCILVYSGTLLGCILMHSGVFCVCLCICAFYVI